MSARFCPQCKAELPSGQPAGLCERCRQSLAGHVTTGPEPTTVVASTAAAPAASGDAESPSAQAQPFDVMDALWAKIIEHRQAVDGLQAAVDNFEVAVDRLRATLAEIVADPDATPWDAEELRKQIGEFEASLASRRRDLDEQQQTQRRLEEEHGRSAVRELLAEQLPQLEIWGLVGRGGMGEIWKARHRQLGRDVAIKVLPPEMSREPGFAERFRQEARALARLSHPNIVTIFDYGEVGGLYFFIMEYLPLDLRWCLGEVYNTATTGLVPVWRTHLLVKAFLPICDAVVYAHEQGVLHRDIKPENILQGLGRSDHKLADFGLVRLMQPGAARLTAPGQAVGTLSYIAPEQLARPGEVDRRADVYALGVVLYEMLTGRLPQGHFDPPSKTCGDERLDPVVLKALASDPAVRYQSAAELKADLEKVREEGPRWRVAEVQANEIKQMAEVNENKQMIVWVYLPLALACYTVLENRHVLPWWFVAALPCVAAIGHTWRSRERRAVAFTTWFVLLPSYTILGQALGWEPVIGGTLWPWAFIVGVMALSYEQSLDWPKMLQAANEVRALRQLPPLRPMLPPWAKVSQTSGCILWIGLCVCFVLAMTLLPDRLAYWLPTVVTLSVVVYVGWNKVLRAWLADQLGLAIPGV
jgi:hypothetical protein